MDLSRLPSDVAKKVDPSLVFLWFSCQIGARSRRSKSWRPRGERCRSRPCAGHAVRAGLGVWSKGRWSSVASTGVPRGWRMLGELCQNSVFNFAIEVGYMERWNILAEPIRKNANAKNCWRPELEALNGNLGSKHRAPGLGPEIFD